MHDHKIRFARHLNLSLCHRQMHAFFPTLLKTAYTVIQAVSLIIFVTVCLTIACFFPLILIFMNYVHVVFWSASWFWISPYNSMLIPPDHIYPLIESYCRHSERGYVKKSCGCSATCQEVPALF